MPWAVFGWAAPSWARPRARSCCYAHERRWAQERELGIIAGTRPLSLGRLVTNFDEDNDGMVAVSETRLPGATAHLALPVSHTGLLLSARVAHEVGQFLEYGHFGL